MDLQKHLPGFWLQKWRKDLYYALLPSAQKSLSTWTLRPKKWGNIVPAVLRVSLAVTPSLPGSWAKSTVLLTDQITNTQRYLGVNTHSSEGSLESKAKWNHHLLHGGWLGWRYRSILALHLEKKISFHFFFKFSAARRVQRLEKRERACNPEKDKRQMI